MEEIILKNMGASGRNKCALFRKNGKIFCKCLDERRAECDMSQLAGDMYGSYCPIYYMSEEDLEQYFLKKIKKKE